jgi:GTP-binding protein LepA
MKYQHPEKGEFILHIIDTPGHVDFSYEVSRSLAACEGTLLLVDASQGIEAQTLSNFYLAMENDLTIIPVINKIDLPVALVAEAEEQIIHMMGGTKDDIYRVSAKTGLGVDTVLKAIVDLVPPPKGDADAPLKALIFDSMFDTYRGVIVYVRIMDGTVERGTRIKMFATGKEFIVDEVGIFKLAKEPKDSLTAGEVGYIIAGIKDISDVHIGDTLTLAKNPVSVPLPGFKDVKPMVFAGIFPVATSEYEKFKDSLAKLKLNDSSLTYEMETSNALGFGFRCGFLGLLHMEIVQERLQREYDMDIINTMPNVEYKLTLVTGETKFIDNPAHFPEPHFIEKVEEPFIRADVIVPTVYMSNIMDLVKDRRGTFIKMDYLTPTRAEIQYHLPLSEIVFDFYDKLKSVSRGYASLDYEPIDMKEANMTKLDILINGDPVDALSMIVHRDNAYEWGKRMVEKLRKLIPRQMFEVAIQAAIGNKVIARETVSALRKNVTAKCYGGDITRKRKLLEKQKEGKKRMKQIGRVEIPQEAFLAVLSTKEKEKK